MYIQLTSEIYDANTELHAQNTDAHLVMILPVGISIVISGCRILSIIIVIIAGLLVLK